MNEKDSLLLGALLHDIGKFWQRTQPHKRIPHQVWSGRFFEQFIAPDLQAAKSIAQNHHQPGYDRLAEIVQHADFISAGMDRRERLEGEKGDTTVDRLSAILEKVFLQKNDKKKFVHKLRLQQLSSTESLFPFREEVKGNLVDEYEVLWTKFTNEVKQLKQKKFNNFFTSLYYVLEKYTWCIPSATYVSEPDISLFDHLKTTAAISTCLFETDNQDKFLYVEGDISGIQDFLYKMVSPQEAQENMAKRLRGKSFYLSLLMETFAFYFLRQLQLSIVNLLWCSGGHFALLAPDIEEKITIIKECEKTTNNWLYKDLEGDLSLNVGVVEANGKDLKDFSTILYKMSLQLADLKKRKFITVEEPKIFPLGKNVCPVCGKDIPSFKDSICEKCRRFEEIGGILPKLDVIALIQNRRFEGKGYVPFEEFGICWALGRDKVPQGDSVTMFSFEPSDFLGQNEMSYGFKFVANEVKLMDEEKKIPATFENLAESAKGAKYLGILRMDVDNLGAVFSIGLGEDRSTSRVTALSRSIDYFFCGYLNTICQEFKNIYVTYAGGDDVFIVGAWNEIASLSQRIHEEFRRYCCENPDLTLSAGIHLCRKKFPISRGADLAGEDLDNSKKFDGGEKNAVTVFEHSVHWQKFKEVIELGNYIIQNLGINQGEKEVISRRFVYQLLSLYKQHLEKGKQDIQWIPKFLYLITRNIDEPTVRSELQRRIVPLAEEISMLTSCVAMKTRKM